MLQQSKYSEREKREHKLQDSTIQNLKEKREYGLQDPVMQDQREEVKKLTEKRDIILQMEHVTKSFASVQVLKDITIALKKGEILGLVGENGAGKSTLMNVLGGIHQRDGGKIYLEGKEFEPTNPKVSKAAGIAFVHQELNLFTNLTVYENLFITEMKRTKAKTIDKKTMKKIANEQLKELGIEGFDANTIVGTLPMGQRQLIEIIKAIMQDAKIIVLDEPTTSLSNKEKEKLFGIMHLLQEKGKSMIFISHILEDVFEHCEEIAVLRDGEIISQKKASETTNAEVIKQMVGRELNNIYPTVEKEIGEVAFVAKDICQEGRFENLGLEIREGEILGLFGLMGAGRTEFLRCLFGVDPISEGHISYKGQEITPITPINCIKNGMAFITENRREEGLMMPKTIKENVVMASLDDICDKSFINRQKESEHTDKIVKELRVKTFDPSKQAVINLSGGNQQKVVFGKWVLKEPKIFFLDEPTRGVDVGAKYEIYSIINDLAKNKSSILIVSSEMEELMGMCDRILVMSHNKITGELEKGEYSQEGIMKAAIATGGGK